MRLLRKSLLGAFLAIVAVTAAFGQGLVQPNSSGATLALVASGAGTTAATPATLPAAAGKTTFICGFSITSTATAGLASTATVTGVVGATMTFGQSVGTSPAVASTLENFGPCLPASAPNTAITVTSAAAGTAGVTNVTAWGFQQ